MSNILNTPKKSKRKEKERNLSEIGRKTRAGVRKGLIVRVKNKLLEQLDLGLAACFELERKAKQIKKRIHDHANEGRHQILQLATKLGGVKSLEDR